MLNFNDAPISLFEHQKEAVESILRNQTLGVFYEVGTGKTYIGLEVIRQLYKVFSGFKVLIVAPLISIPQWESEIEMYLKEYTTNITLINPEKLIRNKELQRETFGVVLFDEAHKVKSKGSKISSVMYDITSRATYIAGLTGTPVANSYLDVYHIFQNLNIKEFNETYKQFLDRYFIYELKKAPVGNARYYDIQAFRTEMESEFKTRILKKAIIKRQAECINLPEKTIKIVDIQGYKTKRYKEIEKGVFTDINGDQSTLIKLTQIQKLHQASNGFLYSTTQTLVGEDVIEAKHVEDLGINEKQKVLLALVEDSLENTQQIIIVYQFEKDKLNIQTVLDDNKISCYTEDAELFKTDKSLRVLLRQYQKSEAVNLQFCKIMIFYSYNYSFVNFEQMCGRIYRSGQTENVTYYILKSKGTVEEKIWDAIINKKSQDEFIKNITKK